jgi:Cytochrome c554 and c-prime
VIFLWLAAFGMLHAQQDYVTGDECLFCHRNTIGATWQKNAHALTLRETDAGYALGPRILRKNGYNKFAILDPKTNQWDEEKFGQRCAGCHATAVDPETRSFSAVGIDCYACHGAVDLKHSGDTSLVLLSKKRHDNAKLVTSICAQCHLRGGSSKKTGLPYANAFVAGSGLFADYAADLSKAGDQSLNPGDRHVYRNVRDVLERGSDVTCLSCHRVHANSSAKHRLVLSSAACLDCHNADGPKKQVKKYEVHSAICEY